MKDILIKFATDGGNGGSGSGAAATTSEADPGQYIPETTNLNESIVGIINAVIGVLGLVCVIVMIIGGVNYMTSSGDAGKVKKAKDTILYGLIGLVVCVLAFAIVNFLITNILQNGS